MNEKSFESRRVRTQPWSFIASIGAVLCKASLIGVGERGLSIYLKQTFNVQLAFARLRRGRRSSFNASAHLSFNSRGAISCLSRGAINRWVAHASRVLVEPVLSTAEGASRRNTLFYWRCFTSGPRVKKVRDREDALAPAAAGRDACATQTAEIAAQRRHQLSGTQLLGWGGALAPSRER